MKRTVLLAALLGALLFTVGIPGEEKVAHAADVAQCDRLWEARMNFGCNWNWEDYPCVESCYIGYGECVSLAY